MTLRVLTIGHSYVVAQNQAVPAAIAKDPRIDLTLAAPRFHHGDLQRLHLERTEHPDYRIVPLRAFFTRKNHVMWYHPLELKRLVRERFDVVHAWEEPYTLPGYQIARALRRDRARFLFRTAQSLVKRYPWPFSHFERATLARADGWVAGGGLVFDAMTSRGFPRTRGRVINLGVDTAHFKPLPAEQRDAIRRSLGITGPVVGFVGRLVEAKGPDVLMAALERVRSRWSLLVLGSGPYEERLRRWARARGWEDRVHIRLVAHDDVPRYLNVMDVLAAPSRTTPSWKEQFGRMVIEAFACGVPVIGSDSGEIPFVIGDAGIVVGEREIPEWARSIARLLESGSERQALADRGLARCRDHYDVQAIAKRYIDFYHELVA